VYQRLREERPVTRAITRAGSPVWLVTRYDDVRTILADPRVSADITNPGFPLFQILSPTAQEGQDRSQNVTLLRMDPPDHTLYRRLLTKNFMVKRVEAMCPAIQKLVDEKIDAMLDTPQQPVDFVQALALSVPSTVLSWILGVREKDHAFFNQATEDLMSAGDGTDPTTVERALQPKEALVKYADELATERDSAEDPGDDILGQLVRAAQEGTITRRDVVNTVFLLTVAGHDTTASMTALGTLTLLQHPDQLAELREKPELIPDAIEELLRYLTVVHLAVARVAAEDIEIGGVVIPKGEGIIPSTSPPTAMTPTTPTPTSSTSTAKPVTTSRSATASTSASDSLWPGWNCT
jgi:cytochrome P450